MSCFPPSARAVVFVCAAFFLSGCETFLDASSTPDPITVDVISYYKKGVQPPVLEGHKAAIIATGDQRTSLEFAQARDVLADQLMRKSAAVVDKPRSAEVAVTVETTISGPSETTYEEVYEPPYGFGDPLYPEIWPGSDFDDRFNPFGYRHRAWRDPFFRDGPYTKSFTRTTYDATLHLRFFDVSGTRGRITAGATPDVEIIATMRTSSPLLADALPSLLWAAVNVYPGVDGERQQVEVPPGAASPPNPVLSAPDAVASAPRKAGP
ncbi:hypothetical protein IHV25_10075 [Phaeovibrio sulfidiphilus]|uniref:DUF4136 domain-containing protein n=1 Tax=Phaeovibrio sulfidiphilus TaxID=1220600 RepID=A0A8J6YK86_9PROT|nr:hypothetical protein [Phaeovibrio sulfidiphilus]MBE1237986.1 hypothetical protein [Phaeovibrio sulfidiphilus]